MGEFRGESWGAGGSPVLCAASPFYTFHHPLPKEHSAHSQDGYSLVN